MMFGDKLKFVGQQDHKMVRQVRLELRNPLLKRQVP